MTSEGPPATDVALDGLERLAGEARPLERDAREAGAVARAELRAIAAAPAADGFAVVASAGDLRDGDRLLLVDLSTRDRDGRPRVEAASFGGGRVTRPHGPGGGGWSRPAADLLRARSPERLGLVVRRRRAGDPEPLFDHGDGSTLGPAFDAAVAASGRLMKARDALDAVALRARAVAAAGLLHGDRRDGNPRDRNPRLAFMLDRFHDDGGEDAPGPALREAVAEAPAADAVALCVLRTGVRWTALLPLLAAHPAVAPPRDAAGPAAEDGGR